MHTEEGDFLVLLVGFHVVEVDGRLLVILQPIRQLSRGHTVL